jgi:transcription antitermination factor NusG
MPTAWHAVRARPNAEGRILIGIIAARLEGYLPVELVRKSYRRGYEIGWRPLFDRYLFVRCDSSRGLPRLLEIEGVAELLRAGDRLAPIADEVIEAIRSAEALGLFDATRRPRFAEGDEVRLPGAFAGLVAKIKSARARRRSALVLELVGMPFRVVASADKLEKIA